VKKLDLKIWDIPKAYVLLKVEPGWVEKLFEKFKSMDFVEWEGIITGPYDMALRISAENLEKFYGYLTQIKACEGVVDLRTDVIHSELLEFKGFHKPVSGLLKIHTKAGVNPNDFINRLSGITGLVNISSITGDTDFLIGLEADSNKDLTYNILKHLHSIDGIRRTETFIIGDNFLHSR
jgi:DNA-binding Lrp family transcriptional regulator